MLADCHAACAGVKVSYPGECKVSSNGIAVGERDPTCKCPLYFVYDPGKQFNLDN
jgi:hypothetical protein